MIRGVDRAIRLYLLVAEERLPPVTTGRGDAIGPLPNRPIAWSYRQSRRPAAHGDAWN
jgi:hypothetical protein